MIHLSTSLLTFDVFTIFYFVHFDRSVMVSCGFSLHFPMVKTVEHHIVFICHLFFFFSEMSMSFVHFPLESFIFIMLCFESSLYSLYTFFAFCKYFLPGHSVFYHLHRIFYRAKVIFYFYFDEVELINFFIYAFGVKPKNSFQP